MRRMTLAARRARIYLRRPPKPRWWQPTIFAAGLVLGTGLLGGLGFWLGSSGAAAYAGTFIKHQALRLSGSMGFAVRDVYADGWVRTDKEALSRQLGVEIGQPILAVDPAAARERLEQLPWVESASVLRELPDRVEVHLIERQPLALWQRDGRFDLIDRRGMVITEDAMGQASKDPLIRYGELRVLVGEQAPRHANRLFEILSTEPQLWAQVAAATWIGDRRWTLRLDNRIDVLLPERNVLSAWRFLARKVREEDLLERAISLIDLRFLPSRLRLRLDPEALQDAKA